MALLFTAALCLPGCSGKRPEEHRYDLKGKVVSVDRAKGEVTVEHEEVKGYMAAMTMPFPVRDAEALKVMEAGDQVQAALVVTEDAYWLDSPVITKGQPGGPATPQPAGASEPQPGAEVPDVKLVNQDGRAFSTRRLRGRALVVTFIYTRCPLPDYCVLMSNHFAEIDRALAREPELAAKSRLLSISIDPEFDTPKVLRSYGAAHTENYKDEKFERWQLATGDAGEVRRVANYFGLLYEREGDQIVHSLRTAVIAPDGKLYKIYRGNEWKPEDVLNDFRQLAGAK